MSILYSSGPPALPSMRGLAQFQPHGLPFPRRCHGARGRVTAAGCAGEFEVSR